MMVSGANLDLGVDDAGFGLSMVTPAAINACCARSAQFASSRFAFCIGFRFCTLLHRACVGQGEFRPLHLLAAAGCAWRPTAAAEW